MNVENVKNNQIILRHLISPEEIDKKMELIKEQIKNSSVEIDFIKFKYKDYFHKYLKLDGVTFGYGFNPFIPKIGFIPNIIGVPVVFDENLKEDYKFVYKD